VGVRSDPAALTDRVRAALSGFLVEDVLAPPNYSIRLESPGSVVEGSPGAYTLYRGRCSFLRTRTQTRVLRALVRCVSAHTDVHRDIVRVRQAAVVGRTGAVLLPSELLWRLEALEPRMHEVGLWLVDPPIVEIDTESREVVVAPPRLAGEVVSFDAGGAPAGRYPIREWAILGLDDEPVSLEVALAAVMPLVEADMSDGVAFDGILRTLRTAELRWVRRAPGARLLDRIVEASPD
jgi:hypothetical protein